jgi:hypothetical protein
MTAFDNFTNPYQDPAAVPEQYRRHLACNNCFSIAKLLERKTEVLLPLYLSAAK